MLTRIFIIEDDDLFADCIKSSIKKANKLAKVEIYNNAIDAMNNLEAPLPSLIFLDVLLPGPDGFTFLNEIASYSDTSKIPVVLVTNLFLKPFDLKLYGIKGILNKEEMKPEEIEEYVERYTNKGDCP